MVATSAFYEPGTRNAAHTRNAGPALGYSPEGAAPILEDTWYVMLSPRDVRPVSLEQLDAAYRTGIITENTQIWQAGMPDWAPLGAVADLEPHTPPTRPQASPGPMPYGGTPQPESYPPHSGFAPTGANGQGAGYGQPQGFQPRSAYPPTMPPRAPAYAPALPPQAPAYASPTLPNPVRAPAFLAATNTGNVPYDNPFKTGKRRVSTRVLQLATGVCLLLVLYRGGVLHRVARSVGIETAFQSLEGRLSTPPSPAALTPLSEAAPPASKASASSTLGSSSEARVATPSAPSAPGKAENTPSISVDSLPRLRGAALATRILRPPGETSLPKRSAVETRNRRPPSPSVAAAATRTARAQAETTAPTRSARAQAETIAPARSARAPVVAAPVRSARTQKESPRAVDRSAERELRTQIAREKERARDRPKLAKRVEEEPLRAAATPPPRRAEPIPAGESMRERMLKMFEKKKAEADSAARANMPKLRDVEPEPAAEPKKSAANTTTGQAEKPEKPGKPEKTATNDKASKKEKAETPEPKKPDFSRNAKGSGNSFLDAAIRDTIRKDTSR